MLFVEIGPFVQFLFPFVHATDNLLCFCRSDLKVKTLPEPLGQLEIHDPRRKIIVLLSEESGQVFLRDYVSPARLAKSYLSTRYHVAAAVKA